MGREMTEMGGLFGWRGMCDGGRLTEGLSTTSVN
jgi:hypothetical protein